MILWETRATDQGTSEQLVMLKYAKFRFLIARSENYSKKVRNTSALYVAPEYFCSSTSVCHKTALFNTLSCYWFLVALILVKTKT